MNTFLFIISLSGVVYFFIGFLRYFIKYNNLKKEYDIVAKSEAVGAAEFAKYINKSQLANEYLICKLAASRSKCSEAVRDRCKAQVKITELTSKIIRLEKFIDPINIKRINNEKM